jgi:hypothetical protein
LRGARLPLALFLERFELLTVLFEVRLFALEVLGALFDRL